MEYKYTLEGVYYYGELESLMGTTDVVGTDSRKIFNKYASIVADKEKAIAMIIEIKIPKRKKLETVIVLMWQTTKHNVRGYIFSPLDVEASAYCYNQFVKRLDNLNLKKDK